MQQCSDGEQWVFDFVRQAREESRRLLENVKKAIEDTAARDSQS